MFKQKIIELPEVLPAGFTPEAGKIYANLPIKIYHSVYGDSSTGLKQILETIQDYLDGSEDTPGKSLGQHFHVALELKQLGQRFEDLYGAFDYNRNHKEPTAEFILKHYERIHGKPFGKTLEKMTSPNTKLIFLNEVADELEAKLLNGRKRIPFKDFDYCGRMVNALLGHPMASKILAAEGLAELSFFSEEELKTKDGQTVRILVKTRPDLTIECPDEVWIFDWKSIGKQISERNMKYAVRDLLYDLSAAMSVRIIQRFTDKPVVFRWVFAESKRPHKTRVRVKRISESGLFLGEEKYLKALQKLAEWRQYPDQWPGYDDADSLDTTLD